MQTPGNYDDTLGKMYLLKAEEKMRDALTWIHSLQVKTWNDVSDFVTVGIWNEAHQKILFDIIEANRNLKRPSEHNNLERELRVGLAASFHMVDHVGGISGLGSMVFDTDFGYPPWRIYNPDILTANFDEGQFGVVVGVPGSGKTATACTLIEEWVRNEDRVAFTNIYPKGGRYANPLIIYVKDAKAFVKGLSILPPGTKWILVLDEAGLVYLKQDQVMRRVKDLDKLVRVIRHLHGSLVIITQQTESVPRIMDEFASVRIICLKPGTISVELKGPVIAAHITVTKFPLTSLPFDTYDIAYFNLNFNLTGMFAHVSGATNPTEAMRQYVEAVENPEIEVRKCLYCGKEILQGARIDKKYCSKPCYDAARRESRGTDETGEVITDGNGTS